MKSGDYAAPKHAMLSTALLTYLGVKHSPQRTPKPYRNTVKRLRSARYEQFRLLGLQKANDVSKEYVASIFRVEA
jgi:hypothetical protein